MRETRSTITTPLHDTIKSHKELAQGYADLALGEFTAAENTVFILSQASAGTFAVFKKRFGLNVMQSNRYK